MKADQAVRWAGLLLLCVAAALAALLELLIVPLYDGGTIMPVTVLFGIVGNVALPRLARALADRTGAMVAVFAAWLLPLVLLAMTPRAEGDVLVRAGGAEEKVFYALLLGGLVAGVATIVLAPMPRGRRPRRPLPR
ncbi:hypothetical protein M6B22_16220 [Jatrophihabitans cynanchi]|uniref:SPW repeat-containing protein n=1 Tax=Jatrophihabitans cynanchi TaxID=2944128 RepID=A0ABY7JXM8_9ACTN|nr:hypothetical protein [Jatrophihabitans sp. SB3-54]WAX56072.1 hypothetical protein M6B22_16220 [Jatrophihabitans sp. SB3-54]